MNFGELKELARAYVTQAKVSAISNSLLALILNEGALDVAWRTRAMKNRANYDVGANQQDYSFAEYVPDLLLIDYPGIYWNNGDQYEQLDPVTFKWLDENFPHWRDADAADPIYYAVRSNIVTYYPKPDTSLNDGFRVHYIRKPSTMSAEEDYPFHVKGSQDEEIVTLKPLSELVLLYWESRALKILGKPQESAAKFAEYLQQVQEKSIILGTRLDLNEGYLTKMKGPKIGR